MNENIFIIYASGLGGNHLGNILSLDPKFNKRFEKLDNYIRPDGSVTAIIDNVRIPSMLKNLEFTKNKSNIFSCHWLEYQFFQKSSLLEHFPNRKFLVIQVPDLGSKSFSRFVKFNGATESYLLQEVTALYKKENITRLINELDCHFVYVWPDMLIDPNIQVILDDIQKQGLTFNLDINQAQCYHNAWLNKNFGTT